MRKRRKYNGVRIFAVSTVILFAAVFLMAHFSKGKTDDITSENKLPAETSGASDTQQAGSETLPSDGNAPTDEAGTDGAETAVSDGDVADVSETEAAAEPMPDPADADNVWAMFLVNGKNPVSAEYCDGIETAKVYESWREYYMDARMSEYMTQMLKAASEDGHQLIVMSAYRSVEYQQKNFDKSVQDRIDNRGMTYDEAYADTLKEVQLPGYSEHNAGLAADIMSDEYVDMNDDGFKNTEAYKWLREHAADYGFILRYPEGKESITAIQYEPWHFRYVGLPHAYYIMQNGLCLEEYIDLVRQHPYGSDPLTFTDENGKNYEVYFVASDDGNETTSIPVPAGIKYEISGNNADGFIVTVYKDEPVTAEPATEAPTEAETETVPEDTAQDVPAEQ